MGDWLVLWLGRNSGPGPGTRVVSCLGRALKETAVIHSEGVTQCPGEGPPAGC